MKLGWVRGQRGGGVCVLRTPQAAPRGEVGTPGRLGCGGKRRRTGAFGHRVPRSGTGPGKGSPRDLGLRLGVFRNRGFLPRRSPGAPPPSPPAPYLGSGEDGVSPGCSRRTRRGKRGSTEAGKKKYNNNKEAGFFLPKPSCTDRGVSGMRWPRDPLPFLPSLLFLPGPGEPVLPPVSISAQR